MFPTFPDLLSTDTLPQGIPFDNGGTSDGTEVSQTSDGDMLGAGIQRKGVSKTNGTIRKQC
jgi:hypothetical protein